MTGRIYIRWAVSKISLLLFAAGMALPCHLYAAACSEGVAEPPFLSYGKVAPNVLLMIDNSASMYDMAYLEDAAYCFDDNYTRTGTYAGYFETGTYYKYNSTTDRFEETGGATAYSICNAAAPGTLYHSNAVDPDSSHACITIDETVDPNVLRAFAAKGNFLNWAASSKFDIEKNILTGGKHDDNNTLIMENRGCADRRFLKQIGLADGSHLTLAVRPPETSEMSDGGDNTTRIEIFPVTADGFNATACQMAVEELQEESPNQGQFKQYVDDCMGYQSGGGNDPLDNRQATFNHSLHYCWYRAKHGEWPPGVGSINSIQNDCELVYGDGGLPPTITPDNRSYVCYGIYDANKTQDQRIGYVGRCWEPETAPAGCTPVSCTDPDGDGDPTNDVDIMPQAAERPYHSPFCGGDGHVYYCDGNFNANQGTCTGSPGIFRMTVIETIAGACSGAAITPAQWTDDNVSDPDNCIEQALIDYCANLEVPDVVDPSDLASQSGEFWNLPAVLIDSGVLTQIDEPVAVMKGNIAQNAAPSGLLQEVSEDLRIGAMTFNDDGAASECTTNDKIDCESGSKDGGRIIANIVDSNSTGHIDRLIDGINDIKALSWTPLAEAMYNAIGYYGQNINRRLNNDDFAVNATSDPIDYWCQNNNILILTEGASTADIHEDIRDFVAIAGQNDGSDNESATCSDLSGSTYLDDLSYYAWESNASSLYMTPQLNEEDKRNIKTYVVSSGSLRSTGTDECSPDILMEHTALNGGTPLFRSEDPQELENNLRLVFSEISTKASSGSAASVISSSRSGEGALYQAIFWPSKEPESDTSTLAPISWTGDVHALFVNEQGEIFEDTDGDRALSANDSRVVLYFDESAQVTKACYDYHGAGNCTESHPLHEVKYLWSAAEWLGKISNVAFPSPGYDEDDIYYNRDPYISNKRQRYIFTWNDLNNDGIVDQATEVIDFADREDPDITATADWGNATHTVSDGRGDVIHDFGASNSTEVNEIVSWVRGADNGSMRSRETVKHFPGEAFPEKTMIWRLGDVVHSTPTAVSRPAEGFHFLYRDTTYADFAKQYKNRRHVIYFGGNDGMLHAINGGFYNQYRTKFCLTPDRTADGDCDDPDMTVLNNEALELGAEMWAYVPYNLLPHLQCMTDDDYDHKYFVDMKPKVFDARIFPEDATHPNGWGTLLVGGMRFGGAPVHADTLNSANDTRIFSSAFFFLDVTDPESPPKLLGETTFTTDPDDLDLGYTVAAPTIVSMRNGTDDQQWYLIMGTGPGTVEGASARNAQVAVLPLNWLTDLDADDPAGPSTKTSLRIPNAPPGTDLGESGSEAGTFTIPDTNSFVSSMVSVDFELVENYKTDAVYFGTVEGNSTSNWSGGLYRLVTRDMSGLSQQETTPSEWLDLSSQEIAGTDYLKPLIDTNQPVTAPVGIGTDGINYWIYFGTGRFYHGNDKSNSAQQTFYGIKEPMTCNGTLTWETVEKSFSSATPGDRGLQQVDQIQVTESTGGLSCVNGTDTCLPIEGGSRVTSYAGLRNYIADNDCQGTPLVPTGGTDGWYRDFEADRERNLGQATLLGGLLTFTSYQPYEELCRARGLSNLYGVYFQTGTAWYEHIFYDNDLEIEDETVQEKTELGMGLSLTPNLHISQTKEGPTAMVQTSTGEIKEITQKTQPLNNFKTGRASWKKID